MNVTVEQLEHLAADQRRMCAKRIEGYLNFNELKEMDLKQAKEYLAAFVMAAELPADIQTLKKYNQ